MHILANGAARNLRPTITNHLNIIRIMKLEKITEMKKKEFLGQISSNFGCVYYREFIGDIEYICIEIDTFYFGLQDLFDTLSENQYDLKRTGEKSFRAYIVA